MTEIKADGFYLDLSESIPVPINYAIADVRDPSKRKRNFTKEIDLPDTSNNRAFFNGAFSLHITDDGINFDATKKIEAVVYKNGIPIMTDAVIKLNEVKRLGKEITFNVTLFSETVDVFLLLSSVNVNELDWSAYDHALTKANIEASWTAAIGTGYYYPLIERGNGRIGNTTWRTIDFIPYVYHREVLIKCLEFAGIEYDSNFIDSNRYKNVLFGWGGGVPPQLSAADIAQREVDADTVDFVTTLTGQNILNNIVTFGGVQQVLQSNFYPVTLNGSNTTLVENTDDLNQLNDAQISVQRTGNYTIDVAIDVDYTYDIGTMTLISAYNPVLQVLRNGQIVAVSNTALTNGLSGTVSLTLTKNIFVQAGDLITFRIDPANVNATPNPTVDTVTLDLDSNATGTINFSCIDTALTDGGTVVLNQFLPAMKCSDFLLGSIRQFNLYQSDADIFGNVTIEPTSDYYSTTNIFDDITELIDHKKEFILTPLANSQAKEYIFTYKSNKDQEAKTYFDKWGENYGDYTYTQGSYYAKGQMKVELPWSCIIPYEISTGILVPRFVIADEVGNLTPNKGEPRIMMRNGLKDGNWTFTLFDGSSASLKTQYPCVHHFDDWEDPDFDLNFKLVNEVFYSATVVTNINCYSEYYSEFVSELTSPSAMMLSCYVKWNAQDIYSMDFGKLKMINGSLWKLNKIEDFDSDIQESTKVELIKVLEGNRPQMRKITFTGGSIDPSVNVILINPPEDTGVDIGIIDGGLDNPIRNSIKYNQ